MLAYEIHELLTKIAENTYPNYEIKKFYITVFPTESKTRHGDYLPSKRRIRIFNLSRPTPYIISTAIHELAHHCEYCIYGDTGHTKRFYQVYKELLETSVKMGVIKYQEVRTVMDAADIIQLEKYFGIITTKYDPDMDTKKNLYVMKVFNCYHIKELLKKRKYTYNSIEQSWVKEGVKEVISEEKEILQKIISKDNIKVVKANTITIEAIYYILVDNCFNYKELLKERNYIYKGYNFRGNYWVKKIKALELKKEEFFLKKLKGVNFKVQGKI